MLFFRSLAEDFRLLFIGIKLGHACVRRTAFRIFSLSIFALVVNPSLSASSPPPCAKCHRVAAERYLATAMGRSFSVPGPYPGGTVTHESSGTVITIENSDKVMTHRLVENGITAEFPVKYQIGGGMMGSTFAVQVRDYLFESPVSWYNGFGWDVSPGYTKSRLLDFDRSLNNTCLFCHATGAKFDDPDHRHLVSQDLKPITCERCHGPGEKHAAHPSSKNIVNPAKLPVPARDSICEQCHLEGAARLLNPGKDWSDFHPGGETEDSFAVYVLEGGDKRDVIPASEVEQLGQSKCAMVSHGKIWCGSCHNPHRAVVPREQEIKAVCLSCHRKLSPAVHPVTVSECTICHMPTSATTFIAHAAHTDHRILRNRDSVSGPQDATEKMVPWREPPAALRQRNLGLGELMLSPPEKYEVLRRDGADLLLSLPAEQRDHDSDVISALEGYYLHLGDLAKALDFGTQLVKVNPQSSLAEFNLAVILDQSGRSEDAEKEFLNAISLDPSLKDAYSHLAILYIKQDRRQDAINVMDRYLEWNPNEILFHASKERNLGKPQRDSQ